MCCSLAIYLPEASPNKNAVPVFLPFLLRMGCVPALCGWSGGSLSVGALLGGQRVPSFARRNFWLPVSGQPSRRLSHFLPLFGIFVTLKIFMATLYSHAGCALHSSRDFHLYKPRLGWCSQGCAGWSFILQEALGLDSAWKCRILLSQCFPHFTFSHLTFVDLFLAIYL